MQSTELLATYLDLTCGMSELGDYALVEVRKNYWTEPPIYAGECSQQLDIRVKARRA